MIKLVGLNRPAYPALKGFDNEQEGVVFDQFPIVGGDFDDAPRGACFYGGEQFHHLDQAQRIT